jgi:hypothetical protein
MFVSSHVVTLDRGHDRTWKESGKKEKENVMLSFVEKMHVISDETEGRCGREENNKRKKNES